MWNTAGGLINAMALLYETLRAAGPHFHLVKFNGIKIQKFPLVEEIQSNSPEPAHIYSQISNKMIHSQSINQFIALVTMRLVSFLPKQETFYRHKMNISVT